jgi:hypothetical protein
MLNYKISQMKVAVKEIAVEIKKAKKEFRDLILKKDSLSLAQSNLYYLRKKARNLNLAYGLARGREIIEIEIHSNSKYDQSQIDSFLLEYKIAGTEVSQ